MVLGAKNREGAVQKKVANGKRGAKNRRIRDAYRGWVRR